MACTVYFLWINSMACVCYALGTTLPLNLELQDLYICSVAMLGGPGKNEAPDVETRRLAIANVFLFIQTTSASMKPPYGHLPTTYHIHILVMCMHPISCQLKRVCVCVYRWPVRSTTYWWWHHEQLQHPAPPPHSTNVAAWVARPCSAETRRFKMF